ncbi:MAG: pilus assembly protein PilM [Minisyncoccia bacterium]
MAKEKNNKKLTVKPQFDWQKFLVPEFTIYGVSLNDLELRVFCFDKSINKITYVNRFALPKGIIKEGILQNPEALKSFFISLKEKLWRKEKNIWLILSLPSANFYINHFSLPELSEEQLKDAIVFNAQMIVPLPLEESYFDWETWGESQKEGEKEIFVALGIKKQIESYWEILNSLGFKIVAIEPYALSLTRFIYSFIEKEKPTLVIDLRNDGIEFIISENGRLVYFDYDSWHEIFGTNLPLKITPEMLKKHFSQEIPMILNFYSLKRQKTLTHFIFLNENENLIKFFDSWISSTYNLVPLGFNLPPYLKNTKRDWAGVIGVALRGLIPRRKDTIVSLAPIQTEEDYYQSHLISIISLWFKVLITVFACFSLVYGLLDYTIFKNTEKKYKASIEKPLQSTVLQREQEFKRAADEFNALVKKVEAINVYRRDFSEIIGSIVSLASDLNIEIKRIFITDSGAFNITLSGLAKTKEAVINFKTQLQEKQLIKDISLPLEALNESPEGVNFVLNGKL